MITSSGVFQSTNKNLIMSPYTGKIISINIAEGMNVEKGDIIFTAKITDIDKQVRRSKSNI